MSRLRARCPDCRTLTAVALGPGYECHACGREFGAGLVRVPRAWGRGGEPMVEAAHLPLPYPEVAVVEEDSLREQNLALAAALPERPLVVGGCCCAHIGGVEGLAARHERLAVVWFDAHGDLNTPATSPSGNEWGMPLRMLLDSQTVAPEDVALVGARDLDPPEEEYIASSGIRIGTDGIPAALDGADAVYVALDVDVLEPDGEVKPFMPTPGGPTAEETVATLARIAAAAPVAGAGITGATAAPENAESFPRFLRALGL
ncbi:MAG TPA: arginase family protein [Gaiellaceae bacterium]|jgi:arginase family enzyme|nr:arginase family protein [Gaiellaceae bacterium]